MMRDSDRVLGKSVGNRRFIKSARAEGPLRAKFFFGYNMSGARVVERLYTSAHPRNCRCGRTLGSCSGVLFLCARDRRRKARAPSIFPKCEHPYCEGAGDVQNIYVKDSVQNSARSGLVTYKCNRGCRTRTLVPSHQGATIRGLILADPTFLKKCS